MTADPRAEKIIDDYLDDTAGHCGCGCGHNGGPILDALAAAGWSLLPPGGQTGEVWRCVYLDTGGAFIAHSREALERHCAVTRCHDPGPLDPPARPWQHQTAQRTVWPDGREHTTPWLPSDTPGEPA